MSRDRQILKAGQMRAAEQALIDAGTSVDALMQVAGRGAAEWIWRMAGRHKVTVLCGPGQQRRRRLRHCRGHSRAGRPCRRRRGGRAATDACRKARALFGGDVVETDSEAKGEVLVDCLFGTD
ncbi:hypothetical protein [Novosphingobium resinovorum]|uniref:hypothetical protein n=1 Tax=Novosphingobium resinovorum TaxID=158500 RepID=UPI003D2E23AD